MPASFQEILNSRLFKFIVGEKVDGSPTEFFVHEEAITQLSEPLCNLIKGGWTESQAGCATWDDVSKETFERFAQFAYTGDYSVPKMEKRERAAKKQKAVTNGSSPSTSNGIQSWTKSEEAYQALVVEQYDEAVVEECPAAPEPEGIDDVWRSYSMSKKDKVKKGKARVFPSITWDLGMQREPELDKYPERHSPIHSANFRTLSFQLLAPRNNYDNTCEPAEHFNRDQSYSNVFFSHASLYVLGDFRLIDSLKALALFKLHKTLCVFQLDDENAEDIIDLARYAYSEEGGGGTSGEKPGGLRSLVCRYMATNALVLSLDDGFMDLLGEGGQFVKDFFKFEVQRTS